MNKTSKPCIVTVVCLALAAALALAGCDRRPSDLPAPTTSMPTPPASAASR
jgi:hypothetical protein